MTSGAVSRTSKSVSALGALLLVGSALAIVAPTASAVSATGVWIFPTANRADAVSGNLKDTFYNTTSNDAWIADAFFADSSPDNVSVSVDFYNPTSTAFDSVQVFIAVNDADLFDSISFSGGPAGAQTVTADELGGGTPLLPDNTGMSAHDVYPAFFASYGVGDLDVNGDISTIYVNATGNFSGGLVLRMDWTGSDANGTAYEGPFDAGMSIYDWGDMPAGGGEDPGVCVGNGDGLKLKGTVDGQYNESGPIDLDGELRLQGPFEYSREPVRVTFVGRTSPGYNASNVTMQVRMPALFVLTNFTFDDVAQVGTTAGPLNLTGGINGSYTPGNISFTAALQLLPSFSYTVTMSARWDGCDGGGNATASITYRLVREESGAVHSAAWWDSEIKKTDKEKRKAVYNDTEFDTLLQAVAFNSPVFTYAPWKGTDPAGGNDEGYLDIGSLSAAHDVMKGRGQAPERVEKAQRQLLALWLNVAVGALNLDSTLEVHNDCSAKKKKCETTFEKKTGLASLGDFDDVGAIIDYAEGQLLEWDADGSYSKAEMKLAAQLCKAVNRGWVELA